MVQSIAVDDSGQSGYWGKLLPHARPRRALLLGLGGGTIARLLLRRFGPLSMVGVDSDAEVLTLARAELGLEQPGLEVIEGDAFEYVADSHERRDAYDYICVDLFRGGQFERGVLARSFLRQLASIATPGAELVFNLFQSRRASVDVQRLARVLTIRSTEQADRNVVVRTGPRGQGDARPVSGRAPFGATFRARGRRSRR